MITTRDLLKDQRGKAIADALLVFSFDLVKLIFYYDGGRYLSYIPQYWPISDEYARKSIQKWHESHKEAKPPFRLSWVSPKEYTAYYLHRSALFCVWQGQLKALEYHVNNNLINFDTPPYNYGTHTRHTRKTSLLTSLLIGSIEASQRGITFYLLDRPCIEKSIQSDYLTFDTEVMSGEIPSYILTNLGSTYNVDALRMAIIRGDPEIVQKLLDKKANPGKTKKLPPAAFFAKHTIFTGMTESVEGEIKKIIFQHIQTEDKINCQNETFKFRRIALIKLFTKLKGFFNTHKLRATAFVQAFSRCQTSEELSAVIQIQVEIFAGKQPSAQLPARILEPFWVDPAHVEKGMTSYYTKVFLATLDEAERIMNTEIAVPTLFSNSL